MLKCITASVGKVSKVNNPYPSNILETLTANPTWLKPQEARELRARAHYERQRPINPGNVSRLLFEAQNGWFRAGTVIWICDLPDGVAEQTGYVVDGNHTLEMIGKADFAVPVIIVRQSVKTMTDVDAAYLTFDLQKSRTWVNAAQAPTSQHSTTQHNTRIGLSL